MIRGVRLKADPQLGDGEGAVRSEETGNITRIVLWVVVLAMLLLTTGPKNGPGDETDRDDDPAGPRSPH